MIPVTALDDVVLDWQPPVIEASPDWSAGPMIFIHKWHGGAVGDAVVDGLERLVLAEVLLYPCRRPSCIVGHRGPVVIVLI